MNAPQLANGDGTMGFRVAQEEMFPEKGQQRCWPHRMSIVLNALPKARQSLLDIWQADRNAKGEDAFDLLIGTYELKNPKAAVCRFMKTGRIS